MVIKVLLSLSQIFQNDYKTDYLSPFFRPDVCICTPSLPFPQDSLIVQGQTSIAKDTRVGCYKPFPHSQLYTLLQFENLYIDYAYDITEQKVRPPMEASGYRRNIHHQMQTFGLCTRWDTWVESLLLAFEVYVVHAVCFILFCLQNDVLCHQCIRSVAMVLPPCTHLFCPVCIP